MSYWDLNQTSAFSSQFARSLKSSINWWRVTCWCLAVGWPGGCSGHTVQTSPALQHTIERDMNILLLLKPCACVGSVQAWDENIHFFPKVPGWQGPHLGEDCVFAGAAAIVDSQYCCLQPVLSQKACASLICQGHGCVMLSIMPLLQE